MGRRNRIIIASESFGNAKAVYLDGKFIYGNEIESDSVGEEIQFWDEVLNELANRLNIDVEYRSVYAPLFKDSGYDYFDYSDEYVLVWPQDESSLKDEEYEPEKIPDEEGQDLFGSFRIEEGL